MTTVALPCPSPARVGGVFGALVDSILSSLRRLSMTPRQRRLADLFGPIIEEIGEPIRAAQDKQDLSDLLDEAAVMPQLLAFELLAAQELADEIDAFIDRPDDFDDDVFVPLFGEGCRAQAQEMARLFEVHFVLLGRLKPEHRAQPPADRFSVAHVDVFEAVRDLACPPDMARSLTAGLRAEAALLALMHGLRTGLPPWLRRALAESAVDDRRRATGILAALVGEQTGPLLGRVGIEPAPFARWSEEYRAAHEALTHQVEAARRGERLPFKVSGADG